MAQNSSEYVTDPATTGKLPAVAADAAPGKGGEALLDHLADLMDQLPSMQARSDRLAQARAAQRIVELHRAKLTADAELDEAERLVARAEEELLRATSHVSAGIEASGSSGAADSGDDPAASPSSSAVTAVPPYSAIDEAIHLAQEQVLHAGLQRGLRTGPANNAAAELEDALANSQFESVEAAEAAVLSEAEIASIEQQIADYQRDYNETLAACQSADQTGCLKTV